MTSSKRPAATALAVVGIAALMALVIWLQLVRERRFPPTPAADDVLYMRSPAVLTRLALSYDAVAADVYWIRTLQYYGGLRLSNRPDKRYDLLYPMLDLTTSLDPRFTVAYRFGAYFLSEEPPGGAGRPDLAIALLKKAMAANPERWEYPHDIAFVYYRRGDYESAGEWFHRAAQVPNAANWLEPMAAVTLTRGGDRQTSRMLLERLYASSETKWLRDSARWRLQQLDALDAIDQLQQITAAYEQRHGRPPETWEAVVRARMLPGVPLDPAGVPYELNPWWGFVTVSQESPLWPLPGQLEEQ